MANIQIYKDAALYTDQFGVGLVRDENAVRAEIDAWCAEHGFVPDTATTMFNPVFSPMLGEEDTQVATEITMWLVRV